MVGLERTVVPAARRAGVRPRVEDGHHLVHRELRRDQGRLNLVAARLSERVGRKPILVAGWLLGLPVPFLIMWAPSWGWIDAANVLLGANQAFAWSMTVIMKVDLVGPKRRGLALGLNEFAGYLVRGVMSAWVTGYIAEPVRAPPRAVLLRRGRAPSSGSCCRSLFVRETRGHVAARGRRLAAQPAGRARTLVSGSVFGRHDLARPESLRRLPGRPRQQPERRDVLGASIRSSSRQLRPRRRGDRRRQGRVPGGLGRAPGRHGAAQRPDRPEGADRGGHARPGRRDLADGARAGLPGVDRGRRAPGARDGHGLPDPARGHRGRRAPVVARHEPTASTASGGTSATRSGALLAGLVADWLGMAAAIHVVATLTLLSGLVVLVRMRETLGGLR